VPVAVRVAAGAAVFEGDAVDNSAGPRIRLRVPGQGPAQESLASSTVLVTWIAAVSAVILVGLALLVRWPAPWP
jgi:hypothetical protein